MNVKVNIRDAGFTQRKETPSDPVTPANTPYVIGWGYPKRFIAPNNVFDGSTTCPVKTTIGKAVKWWRRVKEWKIEATMSVTTSLGSNTVSAGTMVGNWAPTDNENKMTYAFGMSHGYGETLTPSNADVSIFMQLNGELAKGTEPDVYPRILIGGGFSGGAVPILTLTTTGPLPGGGPFSTTGSITAKLDDEEFPLYWQEDRDPFGTYFASISRLEIKPREYWPYLTTSNNSARWDIHNGSQLQDPLIP